MNNYKKLLIGVLAIGSLMSSVAEASDVDIISKLTGAKAGYVGYKSPIIIKEYLSSSKPVIANTRLRWALRVADAKAVEAAKLSAAATRESTRVTPRATTSIGKKLAMGTAATAGAVLLAPEVATAVIIVGAAANAYMVRDLGNYILTGNLGGDVYNLTHPEDEELVASSSVDLSSKSTATSKSTVSSRLSSLNQDAVFRGNAK